MLLRTAGTAIAWCALFAGSATFVGTTEAGYPILSRFVSPPTAGYAPKQGRYTVVDSVDVARPPHGTMGPTAAGPGCEVWERRDLSRPTYPYGWFGAAPHTTQRWTNGGYYDNYVDTYILRGR